MATNGRQVGGEDALTKRCMGESVATDCIVAGGMSELGALTESLLSDGGKCTEGGARTWVRYVLLMNAAAGTSTRSSGRRKYGQVTR